MTNEIRGILGGLEKKTDQIIIWTQSSKTHNKLDRV